MSEKKIQLSTRLLLSILFVIFVTVAVLTIHNHVLKKAFRQVQEAAYIHDADELAEVARKSNPKVKVVSTGPKGLWDKNGMKSNLKLVRELTIGTIEGDTNKIFHHAGPVVADRDGNIFVCEWRDGQIKKFDHEGNYLMTIGRKGLGPGEFLGTLNLAFDNNNSLCVYDFGNQRLSKFSHDGRYIRSINLGADHIPAGLTLDASDKIYISAYDHKREKAFINIVQTVNLLSRLVNRSDLKIPYALST